MMRNIFEILLMLAIASTVLRSNLHSERLDKLESMVEYYEMFEEVE